MITFFFRALHQYQRMHKYLSTLWKSSWTRQKSRIYTYCPQRISASMQTAYSRKVSLQTTSHSTVFPNAPHSLHWLPFLPFNQPPISLSSSQTRASRVFPPLVSRRHRWSFRIRALNSRKPCFVCSGLVKLFSLIYFLSCTKCNICHLYSLSYKDSFSENINRVHYSTRIDMFSTWAASRRLSDSIAVLPATENDKFEIDERENAIIRLFKADGKSRDSRIKLWKSLEGSSCLAFIWTDSHLEPSLSKTKGLAALVLLKWPFFCDDKEKNNEVCDVGERLARN